MRHIFLLMMILCAGCYYQAPIEHPRSERPTAQQIAVERLLLAEAVKCGLMREDIAKLDIETVIRPDGQISWVKVSNSNRPVANCVARRLYGQTVVLEGSSVTSVKP